MSSLIYQQLAFFKYLGGRFAWIIPAIYFSPEVIASGSDRITNPESLFIPTIDDKKIRNSVYNFRTCFRPGTRFLGSSLDFFEFLNVK